LSENPTPIFHEPPFEMERQGYRSALGRAALRMQYEARVQARMERNRRSRLAPRPAAGAKLAARERTCVTGTGSGARNRQLCENRQLWANRRQSKDRRVSKRSGARAREDWLKLRQESAKALRKRTPEGRSPKETIYLERRISSHVRCGSNVEARPMIRGIIFCLMLCLLALRVGRRLRAFRVCLARPCLKASDAHFIFKYAVRGPGSR